MRADGTRYFGAFVDNKQTGAGIEFKDNKWLVRIKYERDHAFARDYFTIDGEATLEYFSKKTNSKMKVGFGIFGIESLGVP